MNITKFQKLAEKFSQKHVLVVGDIMLDSYMWGTASRISQEAPVPVVSVEHVTHNPGGAANVGWNLSSLSAKVSMAGVVGRDIQGTQLLNIISEKGINVDGIAKEENRDTTVKTRVIAQGQQVVRTDMESLKPILKESDQYIENFISLILPDVDGIILADYNKGLLSKHLIHHILDFASQHNVPVYVDPKTDHFYEYHHARLFKPNSIEFRESTGKDIDLKTVNELRKTLDVEHLLITIGAEGMLLVAKDGEFKIPTKARAVHDVSGAGDTVISVYTLSDLAGASPQEAATIANLAAGRVCEEVGVVPINLRMLKEIINHHHS
ncbi:MAG: bifunctional heptose 7-phosphate kinase/heptose 1-phosphate adenyltransferase [Fidelibacterota bacterium]